MHINGTYVIIKLNVLHKNLDILPFKSFVSVEIFFKQINSYAARMNLMIIQQG